MRMAIFLRTVKLAGSHAVQAGAKGDEADSRALMASVEQVEQQFIVGIAGQTARIAIFDPQAVLARETVLDAA